MWTPCKRLLFFALLVIGAVFYGGCGQPEDILTPVSQTKVWLSEQRLPNNPDGMIYELWAANATDSVSLGIFGYDHPTRAYFDENMQPRVDSNMFYLADDVRNYTSLMVSVETVPDNNATSPGPIMLIDYTSSSTIKMTFPQVDSIWASTIRYSMETTSDGLRDPATDGYGIWFANYIEETRALNDTNSIISWEIDTLAMETLMIIDTNIVGIDVGTIITKDTTLVLGLDTLVQTVVRFEVIERIDTIPPYPKTLLSIVYDIDVDTITYDNFSQDNFALPDIAQYGWKYKGWVVSYDIPTAAVGEMTIPAWILIGDELAYTDGGLLTTGTFDQVDQPDDANPYSESLRVPAFPGEDFLQNLPGGLSEVNLVTADFGGRGRVFISIEPVNFPTDTTNFPLLAFIGALPANRDEVEALEQQFTLDGWMNSNDPYRGFPLIEVTLQRF